MNKEKNFVSSVIYVRNAADSIADFLRMIMNVMQNNFEHSEIICVNDCSEDNSVEIIRKTAENADAVCISIINLSYFHGLETAMNAGVDLSIGDFVFEFDRPVCDFDESLVMDVYNRSLQGFDIVSASPENKERFTSKLFYKVFERYSNMSYKMTTERFRILSRRVINRISAANRSIPYRKAIYAASGLKSDNITYRSAGSGGTIDKKEQRYRMDLAVDSLILFTELGYRFSIFMTGLMMILSVFMICYTLIVYFFIHPVEGWTTTVLFLSAAFFGLFGILTIIVKYLQIILNMIFKRRQYTFESIEKIS